MDNELLAHLMSGKAKAKPLTSYAILRNGDKVALSSVNVGSFDSKQGSVRRSKKGRTSIMPNGYARYCPSFDENDVVMYKV
jgi:hypothetical protein